MRKRTAPLNEEELEDVFDCIEDERETQPTRSRSKTRNPRYTAMALTGEAKSIMDGQGSPTISHVKAVARPILRHRIVINYKAKAEGISADDIIEQLL